MTTNAGEKKPKRYEWEMYDGMITHSEGDYVKYDDYEALSNELKILKIQLDWCKSQRNLYVDSLSMSEGFSDKTAKLKIKNDDAFLETANNLGLKNEKNKILNPQAKDVE